MEICRVVGRREPTMSVRMPTSIGDADAQRRFIESYKRFLEEFPALQSLLEEASQLAEAKCYPESPGQPIDAEPTRRRPCVQSGVLSGGGSA